MENFVPKNDNEYFLLRNYITKNCGIVIPAEKSYMIETRLSKFLLDTGVDSFDELYDYLIKNNDPLLNQKVINSITTNETKWFRDEIPWKVLEKKLLPKLIDDIVSGRKKKARIWSAAASTGQEIYSTVMCIDNYLNKNNVKDVSLKDFEFFATDISSHVIQKAKTGIYDNISIIRGLNEYYKTKYFTTNGLVWNIDPMIRDTVKFTHFNLLNNYDLFGSFDIIFCRYILIYFSDALKTEIAAKMYDSLSDKGALFTGNYVIHDLFKKGYDSNHFENFTYFIKKEKNNENTCS
ncbi:MAG: protein-glutamate O-methyltransferase CheR [Treponema sp.]|nr:protein-glutamate O-methyltransferase CheR [Treponema sp.]